jgi:hypothetical protein
VEGGAWVEQRGRTWLFNSGHERGQVPAHIRIDLDARTAEWRSSRGSEERSLGVAAAQ